MKFLRELLPSPAMLVAFVALLIATSSTAYAAGLAANSVGRIHMKDNAITSPEVANGSLKAVDVAAAERVKFRGVGRWHNVGTVGEVPFGATFANNLPTVNATRFRLEGDVVRLDGRARSSQEEFWSAMDPRVVFVLPSGFRPTHELLVPAAGQNSAYPGYLHIGTDGNVAVSGLNQSGWVNLTGVTFTIS